MSRRRSLIDLIEHFWKRVDTTGDCWLWTGEVNNKGYGVYMVYEGDGREKLLAHRFSALMSGLPIDGPDSVVMHACDTPRCVRPLHLSIGTQTDNIRDAKAKERLDLSGLTADTSISCTACGTEFVGPPNARYCSDHCRVEMQRVKRRQYRKTYEEKKRRVA